MCKLEMKQNALKFHPDWMEKVAFIEFILVLVPSPDAKAPFYRITTYLLDKLNTFNYRIS